MYFKCDMAMPVPKEVTDVGFKIKHFPVGRFYKTTLRCHFISKDRRRGEEGSGL
jgi:hypothetical protein